MINKETRIIPNLLRKVPEKHTDIAFDWNFAMSNGAVCYERPIGFETRRIYLNSANKFWEFLDADYTNLSKAVIQAIESCKPEQYSTRKHIKEAGISLCKFFTHKLGGNWNE
jgi:hypothetical protein